MKYSIALGGHSITFEDGTFECADCEITESIPHIFYKDGAESVQKYKYYALGLIHRQPCGDPNEIEEMLDDLDGGAASSIAIGDMSAGSAQIDMVSNGVVNVAGDQIHLKDGMPATYEDQQKLQKHIEVARKQDEIRSRMGL